MGAHSGAAACEMSPGPGRPGFASHSTTLDYSKLLSVSLSSFLSEMGLMTESTSWGCQKK